MLNPKDWVSGSTIYVAWVGNNTITLIDRGDRLLEIYTIRTYALTGFS